MERRYHVLHMAHRFDLIVLLEFEKVVKEFLLLIGWESIPPPATCPGNRESRAHHANRARYKSDTAPHNATAAELEALW